MQANTGKMRPLCIDLFCGLGGWAQGFLSEGYDVIGFDVERHDYGTGGYPGQLVLQDVLTLHGSQFAGADCIVASPPCQAYSYRAMPWKRAKALPPPSNELFDACFRIQDEANRATGWLCDTCQGNMDSGCPGCGRKSRRFIPLVVENVKGAQPWVGRAAWHYGSYYLWGDVPALMPFTYGRKSQHTPLVETPSGTGSTSWFFGNSKREGWHYGIETKDAETAGKTWFGISHGREFEGQPGNPVNGVKQHGSGDVWFDKALDERRRQATAIKNGNDWFGSGENCSLQRRANSNSNSRKAASALIAKIPFELASHIARVYHPGVQSNHATLLQLP